MMRGSDRFWHGRSVLVTGATGFLGGWMVRGLLERGAAVVALVRDRVPRSMFYRERMDERATVVLGDLGNLDDLRRVLVEYDVATVLHLAAQAIVGVAKQDPVGTLEANVRGTWNLLEAARQQGRCDLVVASSDKAYGDPVTLPYEETHPLQGQYPYDVSKSCADLICQMYYRTYGLPVAVTRCGNLFGGGDLNFSRTIPGAIRAAHRGERFQIRSDGKYVRDFLYVGDAVLSYLRLAERMAESESLRGQAFNFSLEERHTVLDIVERIYRKMGASLEPEILNAASSELREQYLCAKKARRDLDFTPEYGMDRGLDETIRWYRDFLEAE